MPFNQIKRLRPEILTCIHFLIKHLASKVESPGLFLASRYSESWLNLGGTSWDLCEFRMSSNNSSLKCMCKVSIIGSIIWLRTRQSKSSNQVFFSVFFFDKFLMTHMQHRCFNCKTKGLGCSRCNREDIRLFSVGDRAWVWICRSCKEKNEKMRLKVCRSRRRS